jgi:hypothetical protein
LNKNYVPKGFKFGECFKKARDCIKTEKYNEVHGLNKKKKDSNKENRAKADDSTEEEKEEETIEIDD